MIAQTARTKSLTAWLNYGKLKRSQGRILYEGLVTVYLTSAYAMAESHWTGLCPSANNEVCLETKS